MTELPRSDTEHDAKLADLYRMASQNGPPPALDDAIRAAAHRAVASKPRLARVPFSRSWQVPLSVAAVLVLSVSLVTLMREEAPEMAQSPGVDWLPPQSAPQRQPAAAAPMAVEPPLTVPKTAAPDQRSSGLGLKPSSSAEGLRRDQESMASVPQSKKEAAGDEQMRAQRSSFAKQMSPEALPGGAARSDSPLAAEQPRQAVQEAAPVALPEAKIQARSEGDTAWREAERMRAQPPVAAMKSARPAANSTASSASAPAMDKLPPQTSGALQSYTSQSPEKWLEQIAELRKQGRLEEARASFADFRRRHPDYPLPPAFREWVKP